MSQYVITYLGGDQPATPEDRKQHFEKYQQWVTSLGEAALSPMNPFKDTHTVNPDGTANAGSSTMMSCYIILDVDSMEKALEIAKACPFLEIDGSLEVSELVQM